MSFYERSHSAAATRNRNFEHAVAIANGRLNELIVEHRRTFGPGSIRGAEINDWRRHLYAEHGLPGLHAGIRVFEDALRRGEPLAMDFWELDGDE